MSIKLKDTIYDLINNSNKLDGKDSSDFSLTTHTHDYLPLSGGRVNGRLTIGNYIGFDSFSDGKEYLLGQTNAGSPLQFYDGSTWNTLIHSGNYTDYTYSKSQVDSALNGYATLSGLATVATSGSYNDLSNKPTIPTNTNQLTNGAGFITSSALSSYLPLSGGTLSGTLYFKGYSYNPYISIVGSGYMSVDSFGSEISIAGGNNDSIYINYRPTTGGFAPTKWFLRAGSNSSWADLYAGKIYVSAHEVWHSGNLNPSNYLPLSGGTLTSEGNTPLTLKSKLSETWIAYHDKNGFLGSIGITSSKTLYYYYDGSSKQIWHAGNFNPSNYLPLTGGTLSTSERMVLNLKSSHSFGAVLGFQKSDETIISNIGHIPNSTTSVHGAFWTNNEANIGFILGSDGVAYVTTNSNNLDPKYKIWHSGNDGSGSGLDADLLDGKQPHELSVGFLKTQYSNNTSWYDNYLLYGKWATDNSSICDFRCDNYSVRVDIAKKLNTARTIWGQSFDGTGNVSGDLNNVGSIYFKANASYDIGGSGVQARYIYATWFGAGTNTPLQLGANDSYHMYISTSGNVGIGTTSPTHPLQIYKSSTTNGDMIRLDSNSSWCGIVYRPSGGYVWSLNAGNPDTFNFWNNYIGGDAMRIKQTGALWVRSSVTAGGFYNKNGNSAQTSSYMWGLYQWGNKIQMTRRNASTEAYESLLYEINIDTKDITFSNNVTVSGSCNVSTLKIGGETITFIT